MEIGLSSASFYPEVNTEDSIKLMASLGFTGGEIFLNTPSEYEEGFIDKLVEETLKYNFNVHSIHCCSSQYEPFLFDKYKRRREDMFVYYRKLCRAAKRLGAACYTFHGMRLSNFNELDKKFIADIYNELSYISMEEGIKLAQENVSWCMSANLEFLKFLNESCSYPIYFTLDIKQAFKAYIDPQKYIEVFGKNIVNFHINDRDEKHICLLPGRGNVNYEQIISKLKDMGYDKMAIIEVYRENYGKYTELKETKTLLEKII
ncbi:sugar phosphate isomerase/epimerase [Clostridium sp. SYSU_GA19001]|uniref:sugar phosphate isomerase/epimerase family protein n=1 Tax=Clostridium caldaquaticum TaxID=2940653 RepID=UPI00207754E2|nr:sugar phosphate isomerase/epimerase [Clostridium caldaquaticum]MCM8709776.1 sugar phosphate isomerase/epimerase [Clostridium caldaquaticum]